MSDPKQDLTKVQFVFFKPDDKSGCDDIEDSLIFFQEETKEIPVEIED